MGRLATLGNQSGDVKMQMTARLKRNVLEMKLRNLPRKQNEILLSLLAHDKSLMVRTGVSRAAEKIKISNSLSLMLCRNIRSFEESIGPFHVELDVAP